MTIKEVIQELEEIERKYPNSNFNVVVDCPSCGAARMLIKGFQIIIAMLTK